MRGGAGGYTQGVAQLGLDGLYGTFPADGGLAGYFRSISYSSVVCIRINDQPVKGTGRMLDNDTSVYYKRSLKKMDVIIISCLLIYTIWAVRCIYLRRKKGRRECGGCMAGCKNACGKCARH